MYDYISVAYVSSADWQYIFIEGKQTDGQKTKTTTTKYYSLYSLLALSYDT